jgi:hypothetical protein
MTTSHDALSWFQRKAEQMSVVEARKEVTRSLKTLEGLIKEKLKQADEAAEEARQPFYEEIGPLLVEAQEQHFDSLSLFYNWATTKFGKSQTQISRYVSHARGGGSTRFKSLGESRYVAKGRGGHGEIRPASRSWVAPVDDVAERARREAFRLAQEDALTRAQEREAERKLALRLIDIGYKVLAKELHPDKLRGDRDAMQRLNRVRDKLRHCI